MEELMVKAIRQFKREHKKAEIRSCYTYGCSGWFGKRESALFHIEYVDEPQGDYKEIDIAVSKN